MARDEPNRSKGYGFVHMATPDAADAAMRALNSTLLGGREVKVVLSAGGRGAAGSKR